MNDKKKQEFIYNFPSDELIYNEYLRVCQELNIDKPNFDEKEIKEIIRKRSELIKRNIKMNEQTMTEQDNLVLNFLYMKENTTILEISFSLELTIYQVLNSIGNILSCNKLNDIVIKLN